MLPVTGVLQRIIHFLLCLFPRVVDLACRIIEWLIGFRWDIAPT
jgi:hypothetical protein